VVNKKLYFDRPSANFKILLRRRLCSLIFIESSWRIESSHITYLIFMIHAFHNRIRQITGSRLPTLSFGPINLDHSCYVINIHNFSLRHSRIACGSPLRSVRDSNYASAHSEGKLQCSSPLLTLMFMCFVSCVFSCTNSGLRARISSFIFNYLKLSYHVVSLY